MDMHHDNTSMGVSYYLVCCRKCIHSWGLNNLEIELEHVGLSCQNVRTHHLFCSADMEDSGRFVPNSSSSLPGQNVWKVVRKNHLVASAAVQHDYVNRQHIYWMLNVNTEYCPGMQYSTSKYQVLVHHICIQKWIVRLWLYCTRNVFRFEECFCCVCFQ